MKLTDGAGEPTTANSDNRNLLINFSLLMNGQGPVQRDDHDTVADLAQSTGQFHALAFGAAWLRQSLDEERDFEVSRSSSACRGLT
jgi:hypothetical protein